MTAFVHLPFRGRIAFAGIMGTRFTTFSSLLAAAAIALSAPAGAQEEPTPPLSSLPRPQTPPQQPAPSRQGPELDVYRDVPGTAPAPVAPPPVIVTTPPPVVAPTPVPANATPTPRPRPERAAERTVPPVARESGAAPPSPAPTETTQPSGEAIVAPQTGNVAEEAPAAPPPAATPAATTDSGLPWGWIGAALALILAGGTALFLRRRFREVETDYSDDPMQEADAPEPPRPSTPATPTRRPATTPQPAADRAWIDIDLTIDSARYSLLGVSIGYRLTLRNRGKSMASDMLVHALIGNADANQNELLRAFFAGTKGMPVHSVVSIAPGQTQVLTNELRLEPGAIEPLELDGRLLLVPLIGFDVHYRWDADGTPGSGRSGSAFIVGQEQVPPTEKLAPFRFDQGPRQYRDVGCRRTALSLAS